MQAILDILSNPRTGPAVRKVRRLLGAMTLAQIHAFKRLLGLKASAPRKTLLIDKLLSRLPFAASAAATFQMAEPAGPKVCVYAAFGIEDHSQEILRNRKHDLPRAIAFERRTGCSWIEAALGVLSNLDSNLRGLSAEARWEMLTQGKVWHTIAPLLASEGFRHDFGSMTLVQLQRIVKVMQDMPFPVGTRRLLSHVPARQLRRALGFTLAV